MSLLTYTRSSLLWLSCGLLAVSLAGCAPEAASTRTAGDEAVQDISSAPSSSAPAVDTAPEASHEGGEEPPAGSTEAATEPGAPVDPEADAALWAASAQGQVEAVQQALERGASVHSRDENGNTALMLAAFDGHESVVRLLIDKGAEVNALNPEGRSPLMFASTFNDPGTVQLLLDNGAFVNARDKDERFTALMFAAAEGHYDVVKVLLAHKADKSLVDIDGDTAADFARKRGQTKVLELLE